jgi:hypothetical protein
MGEPLGRVYHALCNELAWAYVKWGEYVTLFGTKPSRIDLLNRAAGGFFRMVQDVMWEDALLHLTRLTESRHSRRGQNDVLSIRGLAPLIDKPDVRKAVLKAVSTAVKRTEFARDWRNRHIAHRELKRALADSAEPLQPASRADVKVALEAIAEALNIVCNAYQRSVFAYDWSAIRQGGAGELLFTLDDGLKARHERLDRLKSGTVRHPADYAPRGL